MKLRIRNHVCLIVALIMVIGLLPVMYVQYNASTNGHTQDEAVQWAKSMADQHWSISDGSGWTQCTEFIWQYYNYLIGYRVNGNACDYLTDTYGACPSGWTRPDKSTARPGDIVVWDKWAYFRTDHSDWAGEYGHIGIIVSVSGNTMVTVEANAGENYGSEHGVCGYKYNREVSCISGLIRPDFPDPTYHGSELTSGAGRNVMDGDYEIVCAASPNYQLDISGSDVPAASKANVQIYKRSSTPRVADVFTVTYLDNGFYKIIQKGTDMSMDVYGAGTAEGTNIEVYPYHGGSAQQWSIERAPINGTNKAYRIRPKCSGTVMTLDVNGGTFENRTNVQQWRVNDTAAQGWLFIPYQPEQPIAEGRYILLTALDKSYELDVVGDTGSISSGTNVRVWQDSCQSRYNSFDFKKLSNGYYKITHAASGLVLGVSGGGSVFNQNVAVLTADNSDAQQWAVTKYSGGYVLRARNSGYTLDCENTNVSNGVNVSQYPFHGKKNQIWTFAQAEHKVSFNANGGSGAPSAQTKYYKNALTLSSTKPTRTGYSFVGWNTDKNATSASYQPGASYTKDADLTLYAIWKANTYKVTFDANGGSCSTESKNVTFDAKYGELPEPSRTGYTFDGWYTKASGGSKVTASTKVSTAKNHSLYAHWNGKANPFVDVQETDFFFDPVLWAGENGITAGTDETHFSPNNTVMRADAMVFFWAANERPAFSSTDKTFRDVKKKHWAYDAVMWAVENGITGGTDAAGQYFSPQKTCSRSEILQFLYAAMGKPVYHIDNPYSDVKPKHWYYDGAIWAYENGLEKGEDGKFQAKTPCTRGYVVTYLYRFITGQELAE